MIENFELQCVEKEMAPECIDVDDSSRVHFGAEFFRYFCIHS